MPGRSAMTLAAATFLFVSGASAQTYVVQRVGSRNPDAMRDVKIEKSALAGQEVRVWWATLLNADCSPAGTMTTEVLQPPRHGSLRLSDDPFHPAYPSTNPRVVCDVKSLPGGKQAFYTASAGFHGHDRMVIENATSEGRMRKIAIDVDVR